MKGVDYIYILESDIFVTTHGAPRVGWGVSAAEREEEEGETRWLSALWIEMVNNLDQSSAWGRREPLSSRISPVAGESV